MPQEPFVYPEVVEIDGICDGHDHLRDLDTDGDGRAEMTVPLAAAVEEVTLSMGNTKQVVNTSARARIQKDKWQGLVPEGKPLRILVAGLLSKNVDPADIVAGFDKPAGEEDWDAMKVFFEGVSNDGKNSIRHFSEVIPHIKAMTETKWKHKDRKMPLLIHLERKYQHILSADGKADFGKRIQILKREHEGVLTDLEYLFQEVPSVSATVEHVSDHRTFEKIEELRAKGYEVYGGIAPHYREYVHDDLFEGPAFNSHLLCWPLPKYEEDRQAVDDKMLSGKPYYYLGPDRACHANDISQSSDVKITKEGKVVGGQTQIPEAVVSSVIERFLEMGKGHLLNDFLSHNGMRRFGQTPKTRIRFKREEWTVPHTIEWYSPTKKRTVQCVVAMGGQKRMYKVDRFPA